MNTCPVCGYRGLRYPPRQFSTCPSCGTEFESDDFGVTREEIERRRAELRNAWVAGGPVWHSRVIPEPLNWNPIAQLLLEELSFQWPGGAIAAHPVGGDITTEMTEQHGTMELVHA
jgi:hypothetical protein